MLKGLKISGEHGSSGAAPIRHVGRSLVAARGGELGGGGSQRQIVTDTAAAVAGHRTAFGLADEGGIWVGC
jgi:hypothetical protein